jgi:(E)-4-hydroxy-3-methylbut-2-enyl-diphosphate synthase
VTDHTIANEDMIDHVVKLVEAKAAEIEAHKAAAEQAVAAE